VVDTKHFNAFEMTEGSFTVAVRNWQKLEKCEERNVCLKIRSVGSIHSSILTFTVVFSLAIMMEFRLEMFSIVSMVHFVGDIIIVNSTTNFEESIVAVQVSSSAYKKITTIVDCVFCFFCLQFDSRPLIYQINE